MSLAAWLPYASSVAHSWLGSGSRAVTYSALPLLLLLLSSVFWVGLLLGLLVSPFCNSRAFWRGLTIVTHLAAEYHEHVATATVQVAQSGPVVRRPRRGRPMFLPDME